MANRRGSLIKNDALIHRRYFKEVLRLMGIDGMYYQIKPGTSHYNESGEFSALYEKPIPCQFIFDQVPTVSTLKKLGWITELDREFPLVHVDYDLPDLQKGTLFLVEDPLREGKGRLFRVNKIQLGILYPVCATCQVAPVVGDVPENTLQPDNSINRNNSRGMKVTRPEEGDYE